MFRNDHRIILKESFCRNSVKAQHWVSNYDATSDLFICMFNCKCIQLKRCLTHAMFGTNLLSVTATCAVEVSINLYIAL